jgi:TetR/AcrR family transcriptional repressor of lmrAB and yxaGH operons
MSKSAMLDRLMDLFRKKGFDGASVSDISESTGLGKSSLYHHFPDGKEEMALQVLARLEEELERTLFEPMRSNGTPKQKLDRISRFRKPLGRAFSAWIDAVEALGVEAGLPRAVARLRAEDLVVRVEGALVVSAGTGNTSVFARAIRELRESVLAPVPRR